MSPFASRVCRGHLIDPGVEPPRAVPLDARKVNYRRPSFLAKFAELQTVMWQTNQGLTDRHAYDSRPSSWPLLLRGINL